MKSLLSVLLAVMLVVSFVLSHEVVHAQGEQRTITIYGSFRFTDPSGVNHPLGGARVGLYDDSAFAHVEDWYLFPLAETTTGGDGYYTLPTIDDYHGQRVFVSVFTEHRDFIVTSDSPRLFTTSVYDPYHFSTDAVHDIPSGTYSICGPNCITTDRHEYVINDVQVDQNTGDFSTPFGVFDMVYEIHGYLYDNFWDNHEDLDNDEVTHDKWNISRNGIYERLRIRHPSTAVGFFQSSWWHIKIGRDNDYENLRDTVQHEYSHAVMFKLFDGDVPRTLPDHALDDALNPGHALVEGWAEFFPSIVQNNAIYHTYHNLEFDVFHGNSSGDVVEGSVAGTLYDINDDRDSYDGGPPLQEDDDGVPRRPDLMWQVMRDHKPQNIQDFQESWKNDGLGYDSAFDAVLGAHGIPPNRTIIQFTFGRTTSGAPLSDIFRLLSRTLKPEGYGVIATDNSISALVLLQQRKPDLVILDIMMPGFDGFQVLDFIRKRSNIPVIMLTGRGEIAILHDALVLGADDYVRKPFYPRELVARIRAKLRRAETGGTPLPSQLS